MYCSQQDRYMLSIGNTAVCLSTIVPSLRAIDCIPSRTKQTISPYIYNTTHIGFVLVLLVVRWMFGEAREVDRKRCAAIDSFAIVECRLHCFFLFVIFVSHWYLYIYKYILYCGQILNSFT